MTQLTRHAEQRLRRRTGWPRKAARTAARRLTTEGELLDSTPELDTWLYRDLVWLVNAAGGVVTVFPPNEGREG